MFRTLKYRLLLAVVVSLSAACGGQAVYKAEHFDVDSPFRMRTDGEVSLACESARRALLGQGYLIDRATSDEVKGRKAYKNEAEQNAYIEMSVVCLQEDGGSTLFANGLLSAYELKKNASSASVGVSALGSISLPIGQSADSLVKVSEETINDGEFYRRFFAAISIIMDEMRATWKPPRTTPETRVSEESKGESGPQPGPGDAGSTTTRPTPAATPASDIVPLAEEPLPAGTETTAEPTATGAETAPATATPTRETDSQNAESGQPADDTALPLAPYPAGEDPTPPFPAPNDTAMESPPEPDPDAQAEPAPEAAPGEPAPEAVDTQPASVWGPGWEVSAPESAPEEDREAPGSLSEEDPDPSEDLF